MNILKNPFFHYVEKEEVAEKAANDAIILDIEKKSEDSFKEDESVNKDYEKEELMQKKS